eukprot:scaffold13165_cov177-Amphora_coffeaeformis.AAC.7
MEHFHPENPGAVHAGRTRCCCQSQRKNPFLWMFAALTVNAFFLFYVQIALIKGCVLRLASWSTDDTGVVGWWPPQNNRETLGAAPSWLRLATHAESSFPESC